MRKTLQDMAGYIKKIMVPETEEAYEINPIFTCISHEEDIRNSVLAFRSFLVRLYDILCNQGHIYDTSKKAAHEYENRTSISVHYPFLHHVSIILLRIGYFGIFDKEGQALTCGNNIIIEKLSVPKNLECLRFLVDCGICIDGIDLYDKRQKFTDVRAIKITYPDNPAMLLGMKVMARAEIEHGTLVNQNVFLRCDYRILKKDETDGLVIVQDTIKHFSKEVQDFVLQLHHRYIEKGLTCVVEIKGFHIYIKYCYKRKDVWGINSSLNNGYYINVKPTKNSEYADTINRLHPILQELIARGYGCGRKTGVGHCNCGCHGLLISLDDSILELRDDIVAWFDQEVSCLKKKK